ncbi:helix-turn-helix domain-containing protein [Crenobacter cavernae]|uniref:Winged helix-turn-helix domain-containing protein n=1 Tax=Crenobacter cavernae TaxID=2290923 RepID=A0A345Y5W8_9NEIS|nr:helix-turn-helix domain-containing protein [Crenobacter cavernae]AXK39320.1 hypothetical protein DWG20_07685 [Crenobacter cavernae]
MEKKNARPAEAETSAHISANQSTATPPIVTGQCAEVLAILRERGSVLSLELTADRAIPEAAARIHELRAMGFNIITTLLAEVVFRDRVRRKVARYTLGTPAWSALDYGKNGTLMSDQAVARCPPG